MKTALLVGLALEMLTAVAFGEVRKTAGAVPGTTVQRGYNASGACVRTAGLSFLAAQPAAWKKATVVRKAVTGDTSMAAEVPGWRLFPSELPEQTSALAAPGRFVAARDGRGKKDDGYYAESDAADARLAGLNGVLQGRPMTVPAKTSLRAVWDLGDYYTPWHDDQAWLKARLPSLHHLLSGLVAYENADGLLEDLPGWNLIDWTRGSHPEAARPVARLREGRAEDAARVAVPDPERAQRLPCVGLAFDLPPHHGRRGDSSGARGLGRKDGRAQAGRTERDCTDGEMSEPERYLRGNITWTPSTSR